MPRVWLPLGAAIKNPRTERQAIIQRLRKLNYNVVGAENPDLVEISHLRDILAMCEEKARIPELVTPLPRYTKKQIAEALKDVRAFENARKEGRRRLY
jgi:uncharacterized protein YfkK (UPF0435 family)